MGSTLYEIDITLDLCCRAVLEKNHLLLLLSNYLLWSFSKSKLIGLLPLIFLMWRYARKKILKYTYDRKKNCTTFNQ